MATITAVLGLSLTYATVRYNVFKGVPWEEWPTLVVNKAAALSALLLVVAALVSQAGPAARDRLLSAARWLILLHMSLSLVLMGPATYGSFFRDGKLTAAAALSFLVGAIAAASVAALLRPASLAAPAAWGLRAGLFAVLPGVHAALLGFGNWVQPSTWPGSMPPITLLSFLAGLVGLAAGLQRARAAGLFRL